MKVVIVGAGTLGVLLAKNLASDKEDVTIIEKNRGICNDIVDKVNAKVICGDATNEEILSEAGVDHCDFFITVTGADETNLLCCLLCKDRSQAKLATRVTNEKYKKIFEQSGVNIMVSPEAAGAQELELMVVEPDVLTMASEHKGGVMLLENTVREKSLVLNKKVSEIETNKNFRLVSIKRKEEFLIPTDDTKILLDDSVIVITIKGYEQKIRKLFK